MKYKIVDIEKGIIEKESGGNTYKYKSIKIEIDGVVREYRMSVGSLKWGLKFEVVEINNGVVFNSKDEELNEWLEDNFMEDIYNEID